MMVMCQFKEQRATANAAVECVKKRIKCEKSCEERILVPKP